MDSFSHSIGKTIGGLLLLKLLRDLLKTSCTGGNEAEVRSRRIQYLALVFGMELDAHIPRVILQFNHLHALTCVVLTNEIEPSLLQPVNIVWIHFIAMSVTLFDRICISV